MPDLNGDLRARPVRILHAHHRPPEKNSGAQWASRGGMRSGRFGQRLNLLKYKRNICRISDPAALPNLAEIRQTQPRQGRADNFGMHVEPEPAPEDFYTALWIGALLIAGDTAIDAFPGELNELATD
jgi:hypothetical protein